MSRTLDSNFYKEARPVIDELIELSEKYKTPFFVVIEDTIGDPVVTYDLWFAPKDAFVRGIVRLVNIFRYQVN